MALIISAWTGDNATPVLGRPANTLLVTINTTDGTPFPTFALTQTDRQLGSLSLPLAVPWYPLIGVACLVPLTNPDGPFQFPPRPAVVIGCMLLPFALPGASPPPWDLIYNPPLTPSVYLIELAQVVVPNEGGLNIHTPWRMGINLFSITLQNSDASGVLVSAVGTVPIDDQVTTLTWP